MRLDEIENLNEGIEDKGIFKAIFFAGLPGSGKSTIAARITDGQVSPRTVNTDRSFEFLSQKQGLVADSTAWALVGAQTKTINNELLANYLNGMLPLYVDSTSSNPSSALRRVGLLESLGYDTMMIWVEVSLEEAIDRASQRDRKVDPDFIKKVYETVEANKPYYAQRFGNKFLEVDNSGSNFDAVAGKVGNVADKFFMSQVENPIGQNLIKQMREEKLKYLVPDVYSNSYIKRLISVWYS